MKNILKLSISTVNHGSMTMALPPNPDLGSSSNYKSLHNGVTAAVVDHVGGFAAWSMLTNKNKLVSTVDLSVSYLNDHDLREEMVADAAVISMVGRIRFDSVWFNFIHVSGGTITAPCPL